MRLTALEKAKYREKALKELEKHNYGITHKALLQKIQLVDRAGNFFKYWFGDDAPLKLHLSACKIRKLGLKTAGLESYSENTLHHKRIPVLFHPKFRDLALLLKPVEKMSFTETPTSLSLLEAQRKIDELRGASRRNVEKSIEAEAPVIHVVIKCPKCGHELHLKAA